MILAVGFDSFLEKRYYLDEYNKLGDNQVEVFNYDLGGKSIDTARVLKNLNLDVFLIGFLGGLSGRFIFEGLKDLGIYNDFINIKDDTPANILVFQNEEFLFKLKEPNPRVTREELVSFYNLYERIVYKYEFICAIGKVPIGISKDIYFNLIKIAKNNGRRLILDISGEELSLGIQGIPYMIKLKPSDLEELSKIKIRYKSEMINLALAYIEKGIKIIVIDLDEAGSLVLTEEFGYRVEIINRKYELKEDNGYMIAGYAFGLSKKYDFETIIKLGQSMRIAYGSRDDLNLIDMSDIKKEMKNIEITKINY